MSLPDVTQHLNALEPAESAERYNYGHFRPRLVAGEVVKTVAARGIAPGEPAPDFELPMVGGGTWRLARHLNPPILLRFGSFS
jgi:hypothetical protein